MASSDDRHTSWLDMLPKTHAAFQERTRVGGEIESNAVEQVPSGDNGSFSGIGGIADSGSFSTAPPAGPKRATFAVDTPSPERGANEASFMSAGKIRRDSSMLKSQMTVSNLLTFVGGKNAANVRPQNFGEDVGRTRKRLKDISRRTIDPRSRFVRIWDALTVIALMFTAFVTPFEVGFYQRGTKLYIGPINFICNRIVDAIKRRNLQGD